MSKRLHKAQSVSLGIALILLFAPLPIPGKSTIGAVIIGVNMLIEWFG